MGRMSWLLFVTTFIAMSVILSRMLPKKRRITSTWGQRTKLARLLVTALLVFLAIGMRLRQTSDAIGGERKPPTAFERLLERY